MELQSDVELQRTVGFRAHLPHLLLDQEEDDIGERNQLDFCQPSLGETDRFLVLCGRL